MELHPNFIVNSQNQKIAVQLDIETYQKITEVMEDYALYHLMDENANTQKLNIDDAKDYYRSLKAKSDGR